MFRSTPDQPIVDGLDRLNSVVSTAQQELFRWIAEADRRELWRDTGARDMAHWLSMRYGISRRKALRWLGAAHALQMLPLLSQAFSSGGLGIDKVVELARFATPDTEPRLIRWAETVSSGCIRRRADAACRRSLEDVQEAEDARFRSWWHTDDGRRLGLQGELPAAQGAVVVAAIERMVAELPAMPGEEGPWRSDARRADALVALCSARTAQDPDPDRATVVVHAPLEALVSEQGGCEVEGGGVIHPETARRLACDRRIQVVMADGEGQPLRLGRTSREPTAAMMRQLRHRDRECRFPGCGARRFTQAHHVVWWSNGGATDLDNLVLICGFHHKLVHEFGWSIARDPAGEVGWLRPDGSLHRAGPGPPSGMVDRQPALAAVG